MATDAGFASMILPNGTVILRESAAAREAMAGRLDLVLVSNEEWLRIEVALTDRQEGPLTK